MSLGGVEPIPVTYHGGDVVELWTVSLCLSGNEPQPPGSLVIRRDAGSGEGGTFDARLVVLPRLVFQRVTDGETRVLDYAATDRVPLELAVNGAPWLGAAPDVSIATAKDGLLVDADCDPETPAVLLPPTSNFLPGLRAIPCDGGGPGATNIRARGIRFDGASLAFAAMPVLAADLSDRDSDGDGIPDRLDNCPARPNPSQEDTDEDGVGDECDNCPLLANPCQEDVNRDGVGDGCDPSWSFGSDRVASLAAAGAPLAHDMAVTGIKAAKRIKLDGNTPSVTRLVWVLLQNRGTGGSIGAGRER